MMKRKFKAWDKVGKRWFTNLEEVYLHWESGVAYVMAWYPKTGEVYLKPVDAEIVFFTGIVNKKGQEYYEGDIINFRANYTNKPAGLLKGVIVFSYDRYVLKVSALEYDITDETEGFDYNSKRIGNIYENPELLTEPPPDNKPHKPRAA